jgi:hypothetical protein
MDTEGRRGLQKFGANVGEPQEAAAAKAKKQRRLGEPSSSCPGARCRTASFHAGRRSDFSCSAPTPSPHEISAMLVMDLKASTFPGNMRRTIWQVEHTLPAVCCSV